uniref:ATP-binding cassette domain-containing protein n=1 Tax=Salmonella enterica TaxID=28901 RepID=UPI0004F1A407
MIKLTGLSKAYDGNQVLNSIDLEVKKGEIVVIIGPSGTGKSNLLRCLNLLETPDAGNLAIDDLQLNLAKASEQQAI